MGAKTARALKAPAWTSAQATDCDLQSRSRKSISVWGLSLLLSLRLSVSLFPSLFFSSHIIISISIFHIIIILHLHFCNFLITFFSRFTRLSD